MFGVWHGIDLLMQVIYICIGKYIEAGSIEPVSWFGLVPIIDASVYISSYLP